MSELNNALLLIRKGLSGTLVNQTLNLRVTCKHSDTLSLFRAQLFTQIQKKLYGTKMSVAIFYKTVLITTLDIDLKPTDTACM